MGGAVASQSWRSQAGRIKNGNAKPLHKGGTQQQKRVEIKIMFSAFIDVASQNNAWLVLDKISYSGAVGIPLELSSHTEVNPVAAQVGFDIRLN